MNQSDKSLIESFELLSLLKKPYGGYGLPSPAIRIHIAGASPA